MLLNTEPEALLTVPDVISVDEDFMLTGNEYLSLPFIKTNGGIESLNVISYAHRGLFEFCGSEQKPLLLPQLIIDEAVVDLDRLMTWKLFADWIPSFEASINDRLSLQGEVFSPPGYKGICYRIRISNTNRTTAVGQFGWQGNWKSFNYIVFKQRELKCQRLISPDRWTRSLVLEASSGPPLAALALASEPDNEWSFDNASGSFKLFHTYDLKPGESFQTVLYLAVNLEADGAATTTMDLRRHGAKKLYHDTAEWLDKRRIEEADHQLEKLLNRNLLFSYFFALGRSLDNDKLIPVTSRSPRYYVSAAFWSRDTLLWSFPAILLVDQSMARELLQAVFQRHLDHAGDHAHYINGTVLYPGFELDQLAAFFLALEHYIDVSNDYLILRDKIFSEGLSLLAEKAADHFDPQSGLYSTFLDPSDDPVHHPFLTYSNALLYRSFCFLANLQSNNHWNHDSDFAAAASALYQAICEHCIVEGPFGMMFAWSVDGQGSFMLYDNPPGSLQLLAHYGFCSREDTTFLNTVRWIRSSYNRYFLADRSFSEAGSLHAGNPWPLAACNDLLAGNENGIDFLKRATMDQGYFCETIDPESGRVSTGAAFASAAGFMAHAIRNRQPDKGNL